MSRPQWRVAENFVREAKNAATEALLALDYEPQSACSEEIILAGIVHQLADIQRSFALRSKEQANENAP